MNEATDLLSIPEIFDRTISIFARSFGPAALSRFPSGAVQLLFWTLQRLTRDPTLHVTYLALWAIAWCVEQWGRAAAVAIFSAGMRHEPLSARDAYRRTRKVVFSCCIVSAPPLVFLAINGHQGNAGNWLDPLTANPLSAVLVALVLVVIALLYLLIVTMGSMSLALAFVACVLEEVGPWRAFQRGFRRTLGRRLWRRAAAVVLITALLLCVTVVPPFLAFEHYGHDTRWRFPLEGFIAIAIALFLDALAVVYSRDIQVRQEGLDLVAALAAMPSDSMTRSGGR